MSIGKDLFNYLVKNVLGDNPESVTAKPMSEEDILKAIDNLPEEPVDYYYEEETPVQSWYEGASWVEVPSVKSWAEFKYLGKPEFRGLSDIDRDNRIYFTIPLGFEWEETIKFWFVTFPLGGGRNEVKEFFTAINPLEEAR